MNKEWINKWMNEWKEEGMNEWMNKWMKWMMTWWRAYCYCMFDPKSLIAKLGTLALNLVSQICFYNPLWPKWGQLAALYAIKGYFYQQE